MKTKIILFSFLCLAFYTLTSAQLVRFGFIGNSITIGTGLASPQTECYPAQIGVLLKQKYGDTCEVRNFAVSGRTMLRKGDFPIWNEPDFQKALNYAPDVLFVLLGTNDSKPQNWDAYGNNFFSDYSAMLDTFRWRNPRVKFIVCLPPPAFQVVWGIRDSVIKNYIIPLVDSISRKYNALLVDFYTPLLDSVSLFPDKIHPNARGAKAMAKIAFDRILESDIIHQVDTGYTFVTSCDLKPMGDLRKGDTVTITYTTLRAQKVYFNGQEVNPNGSLKLAPPSDARYVIKAVGTLNEDSIVYIQKVYIPVLSRILAVGSKTSFFPGDSIIIFARYFDQKNVRMYDTTFNLTWTVKMGKGRFINPANNQVVFIADSTGNVIVNCQAENGVSYDLKLFVREPVSVSPPITNDFVLYPNPASEYLFLTNSVNSFSKVEIFNAEGKLQFVTYKLMRNDANTISINISQLPVGIYYCRIVQSNHVIVRKFVVSH